MRCDPVTLSAAVARLEGCEFPLSPRALTAVRASAGGGSNAWRVESLKRFARQGDRALCEKVTRAWGPPCVAVRAVCQAGLL